MIDGDDGDNAEIDLGDDIGVLIDGLLIEAFLEACDGEFEFIIINGAGDIGATEADDAIFPLFVDKRLVISASNDEEVKI